MNKIAIYDWDELEPLAPTYALVASVDLVIVRWEDGEQVSVLYGRCLHRGALMADGHIMGDDLICGLHNWDYAYKTRVSSYNPLERLHHFSSWVEGGKVWVDEDEIKSWAIDNPQPHDRDAFNYIDIFYNSKRKHGLNRHR